MTACPTPLPGSIHRPSAPTFRRAVDLAGLARIVIRVRDLGTSLRFFGGTLGLPVAIRGRRTFVQAGGSELELREQPGLALCGAASTDVFTLGCADAAELHRAAGILAAARVPNTGLMADPHGNEFVRFTDPDGRIFELMA